MTWELALAHRPGYVVQQAPADLQVASSVPDVDVPLQAAGKLGRVEAPGAEVERQVLHECHATLLAQALRPDQGEVLWVIVLEALPVHWRHGLISTAFLSALQAH